MNRHERRRAQTADVHGHIDTLRQAKATIAADDRRSFRLPNGQTFTTSGQDLVDTAEGFVAFFDAMERGDTVAARIAARALGLLPE